MTELVRSVFYHKSVLCLSLSSCIAGVGEYREQKGLLASPSASDKGKPETVKLSLPQQGALTPKSVN